MVRLVLRSLLRGPRLRSHSCLLHLQYRVNSRGDDYPQPTGTKGEEKSNSKGHIHISRWVVAKTRGWPDFFFITPPLVAAGVGLPCPGRDALCPQQVVHPQFKVGHVWYLLCATSSTQKYYVVFVRTKINFSVFFTEKYSLLNRCTNTVWHKTLELPLLYS